MSDQVVPQAPSTRSAVLAALESQRAKIERWKAARIKEIDREAGRELAQLERTARAVTHTPPRPQREGKRAKKASGRQQGGPRAQAAERRAAVMRLLEERDEPLAIKVIARTLNISTYSARTAVRSLVREGKARRLGTGSETRYAPRGGSPRPPLRPVPSNGDTRASGERVMELVRERGHASPQELGQAMGADLGDVRSICGPLVADGVLRMARRDGRAVYVAVRAAA